MISPLTRIICNLLFCLAAPCLAGAQKQSVDTINADRPDQTESPHLVSRGKLQIESGIMVNPFDSSGGKTPVIGMVVLRYGLTKKLELRLMAEDGRDRDRFIEETTQGVFPLGIGGKALLLERERGIVPQMALLAWLKLPFTSRTSEQRAYWSPQVLLAFENRLSDALELEYNIGAKQEAYGKAWQEMGSLSLHIELSKKLKLFGEYFGHYQSGEDPVHNVDGGIMYVLSPTFQLDLSAGRSLSAPAEKKNSFGSLGFSVRLPD
jgi:hypothetical protein